LVIETLFYSIGVSRTVHVLHYVGNFLNPTGGSQIFLSGLVHNLQNYGITQSVVTRSDSNKTEVIDFGNIRVYALPRVKIGSYNVLRNIFSILTKNTFDIIHIHGYGYYVGDIVCMLKKLKRLQAPLILNTHGTGGLKHAYLALDLSKPFPFGDRLKRLLHFFYDITLGKLEMKTFDKIIISSEEERRYFSLIGLKENKCIKIPIAISNIFFEPYIEHSPSNRDYILYAGRIDRYKGLDTLLKTMKELRSAGINLRCVIAGKDYGYRYELERQVSDLGIKDAVEIKGHVSQSDLLRLYSSALVTVLLSDSEGFPLCLVESLAMGTPFIGTPVGAISELVETTNAGMLVAQDDPRALAEMIKNLLKDIYKWSDMSRNGKNNIGNFTWQKIAKTYYEIYLRLIQ
jgi:glycosyltransferase involved in cell wall biosynthesis